MWHWHHPQILQSIYPLGLQGLSPTRLVQFIARTSRLFCAITVACMTYFVYWMLHVYNYFHTRSDMNIVHPFRDCSFGGRGQAARFFFLFWDEVWELTCRQEL